MIDGVRFVGGGVGAVDPQAIAASNQAARIAAESDTIRTAGAASNMTVTSRCPRGIDATRSRCDTDARSGPAPYAGGMGGNRYV